MPPDARFRGKSTSSSGGCRPHCCARSGHPNVQPDCAESDTICGSYRRLLASRRGREVLVSTGCDDLVARTDVIAGAVAALVGRGTLIPQLAAAGWYPTAYESRVSHHYRPFRTGGST